MVSLWVNTNLHFYRGNNPPKGYSKIGEYSSMDEAKCAAQECLKKTLEYRRWCASQKLQEPNFEEDPIWGTVPENGYLPEV